MEPECIWSNFLNALFSKVLIKVMIQMVPSKKKKKRKGGKQ